MNQKERNKTKNIIMFITPALAVVTIFILLPLAMSMYNSLFDWNQMVRLGFVGLGNFKDLLFEFPYSERFSNALTNNVKWFLSTMLIQNTFGLFFGYLLSRNIAGSNFFKRIFFLPVLFSIVAVGFLWGMYLKPDGLLNYFLKVMNLTQYQKAWLGDAQYANKALILVNIWRWVGFPSLVFLAAIDNISEDNIEAAYLDGASSWKIFTKIIFPLIIPSITIIFVLTTIGSLNVFEQIFTMTGVDGAPNYATDTIGTLFYRTAFGSVDAGNPEVGMGSAISVVIYVLTFSISLITIATSKTKEVEL